MCAILFCFVLLLLFLFVFFLQCTIDESGMGSALVFISEQPIPLDTSPCVGITHYFTWFDCSPFPSCFVFLLQYGAFGVLVLAFLLISGLSSAVYMVTFLA